MSLGEEVRPQLEKLMEKAQVSAQCSFVPPAMDSLETIKERADEQLDPTSDCKRDIYLLINEVKELRKKVNEQSQ